jgi:hypothetical protein
MNPIAMEIHFCDVCNESVPQSDLDQGHAVTRKGRVICRACEVAMTAVKVAEAKSTAPPDAPPAEPAAATGSAGEATEAHRPPVRMNSGASTAVVGAVASIALFVSIGAAAFLLERIDEGDRAVRNELVGVQQDARDARRDAQAGLAALRTDGVTGREALDRELRALQDLVAAAGQARASEAALVSSELTRVAERLAGIEALAETVAGNEVALNEITAAVLDLGAFVDDMAARIAEVEALPAPAPVVALPAEPAGPEWAAFVDQLESPNSGDRWAAVQSLGDTGDPEVAPVLAPILKDPDIFVRMATARVLGDLRAVAGIPPLIAALEDPEGSVREAAVVALRSISGENFRFDPAAKQADRAKRIKHWVDWWEGASEELLAGGPTVP